MNEIVLDAARERLTQIKAEAARIENAIREAEGRKPKAPAKHRPRRVGARNISPEARERIAEAQRKRWANFRKEKAA